MRLISLYILLLTTIGFAGCASPNLPVNEPPTSINAEPKERSLSGTYSVSGAMGTDEYNGVLTISNQDDAYNLRWMTNQGSRIGVGIQMGGLAAATFAKIGGGDGCGVALYKIAPDGTLTGRTARWGEYRSGTEEAVRTSGDRFAGEYRVTGTHAGGKPYEGTLAIKKNGEGYEFEWRTPKPLLGFGIWKGSHAAVSFGGRQCSFAVYEVLSNGDLDGNWGGQLSVTLGTEKAKLQ